MIDLNELEFAQANLTELEMMLEWARVEGWNPGLHDAASFFAADQHGYYLAKYRGEAIACLSGVEYGSDFGFVGLYICRPEFRRQACAYALWQHVLRQAQVACLGLDGVIAQQANYQISGFRFAHRNCRFKGTKIPTTSPSVYELRDAREVPFADLAAFDRSHFMFARDEFLRAWINQAGSRAYCLFEQDRLSGFAVLRPCWQGYKIGPLFAENQPQALALLQALLASHSSQDEFYLDVPEPNRAAFELMQNLQWQACFETARMYAGAAPALPLSRIFGITSLELG